jgi:glycosyltransferase involved in cell wall biosynthesis
MPDLGMSNITSEYTPRVSVVTPFLNGNEFMDEAISSVLDQTLREWELLLVDDGSTDGSSEKAKHYADTYPSEIRYFAHAGHGNLGQGVSRNVAIHHARGDYVAFLDVDDFWLPEKLENQVHLLEAHPEAAMIFGPYFLWYSWSGHPEDMVRDIRSDFGNRSDAVVPPPIMLLRHIVHEEGLPAPSSAMVRRTVLEAIGGFESEFTGMYDDEACFTKITLNYPVFVTSGCWDRYRQHAGSFCACSIRDGLWDPNPKVPSPDRVRLLRWQLHYVETCSRVENRQLLEAIRQKMSALGMQTQ